MEHRTQTQKKNLSTGTWLLFSFKGRISRKPYWIFNLCIFIAGMVFGLFVDPAEDNISEINKSQLIFMFWILWPSLAVQAKRWHDRDKSALWILINFIPIVGPIWALIENGFMPGTRGPNRFGPDPLDNQGEILDAG